MRIREIASTVEMPTTLTLTKVCSGAIPGGNLFGRPCLGNLSPLISSFFSTTCCASLYTFLAEDVQKPWDEIARMAFTRSRLPFLYMVATVMASDRVYVEPSFGFRISIVSPGATSWALGDLDEGVRAAPPPPPPSDRRSLSESSTFDFDTYSSIIWTSTLLPPALDFVRLASVSFRLCILSHPPYGAKPMATDLTFRLAMCRKGTMVDCMFAMAAARRPALPGDSSDRTDVYLASSEHASASRNDRESSD